ncbi:MAG TPA: pyridoxal-phosphate dependent enzyme, partial [Nitrososphaerales archaeon]|nr:pyridoxal-phosphate dependent enzyme [Nitrososphaerales archaeon]
MQAADSNLLQRFNTDVLSKVPHPSSGRTVNPTPLLDVTGTLAECAAAVYGIGLDLNGSRVFAKFDSGVHGGSIKVRPAVSILGDAIGSGKLTSKQTVFEATSGNFGIALSLLGG